MIRKILKLLIILIISIFIGNIAYGIYKEFSLNDTPENLNFINTISEENTQPETKNKLSDEKSRKTAAEHSSAAVFWAL